jgi:hypothetical protein
MRLSLRPLLFLIGLLPALLHAEACRVGEVVRVVGTVSIVRQTQAFSPFPGVGICRGDRVRTAAGSIAELRLRDGTLLTVGKDSEFVIRDFRIYRDQPNVALFDLVQGAFRSVTGLITQRSHRYEVRTRVATIGVRGTDFWGGYGLTEQGLDVVMLEGHGVYVKTETGTVELDKPGLGTTVLPAAAPTDARTWGEAKLARAMATITP